mmetsp:Transcript_2322/g.3018  ORF Transcript_2322/g.3018 Transcript_2322/m.3018 type:complete len:441 (-) Transcript_2322:149-1471(-)|eukprot:CAMPEP_0172502134 /NCGR_PEP_ID=MMETSP1066-20121228/157013_1 /TAXON_ID=671091 /ORGANISM="Coscinodiscus wailesii, Strain CCMP2513" /LENGTH=440 /DNA_ID=CAMNT_0013277281 /DNA_START=146 /DNA_END=1468 /DNA_ORIENTATION=-
MSSKITRWSPLTCFPPGPPLTPAGLLTLDVLGGEVELITRTKMEIRVTSSSLTPYTPPNKKNAPPTPAPAKPNHLPWIDRDSDLTCTLTTHRLVFTCDGRTRQIHLSNVLSPQPEGGGFVFRTSLKITFHTSFVPPNATLQLVFDKDDTSHKDRDDFLSSLAKSLSRKAWEEEKDGVVPKKDTVGQLTKRKVGVDAIIEKNKLKHKEAALISDKAFENDDVEEFLKEAKELVTIIHKYVATLEKDKKTKNSADENGDEDERKLTVMLEDMGMASALSAGRQSGDAHYELLARQICDFLRRGDRLSSTSGGMMTLTDLYCLFNRARGTNLISPEDLLAACDCLEGLNLGLKRRKFPSGVIVVQSDDFDDDVVAESLKGICDGKNGDASGVTSWDASRILGISALLANEQLLAAERRGVLCRDVTLEGVRFFPNKFVSGDFG